MKKPEIVCDLNQKKWLNLQEAIAYLGFGSKDTFQSWREGVRIHSQSNKMIFLKSYKTGKNIVYKRTDIDNFMEEYQRVKLNLKSA
ncbi:MerR family transcriptional regulator [Marinifilum sp. D737]|uniref:hypothetical protein n=1 Tax=Marinifilum sp. D737 TaxID=2969628 RepID=UPI002276C0CF|nr:hypothetical protein [Marinifilum sp. D737]MCY1635767.1 helix-turn-helix domain-containing protein [Marinifilum sp. D737]